ncbi:MAG: Hpt domain-containing protein, partial [Pseudomonadales bacterium]|nr:Hpt domain-containing protein [Pseudomonadales bacterium]
NVFTEPAAELELLAKAQSPDIGPAFARIRSLQRRIALDAQGDQGNESARGSAPAPAPTAAAENLAPIHSTLPMANDRFRDLIARFVDRLDERVTEMESAVSSGDAEALASLGHWLKGSGGSVGFHEFDEPGAILESAARAGDLVGASEVVKHIRSLCERIELPGKEAI